VNAVDGSFDDIKRLVCFSHIFLLQVYQDLTFGGGSPTKAA
jgi:hypothetical protein